MKKTIENPLIFLCFLHIFAGFQEWEAAVCKGVRKMSDPFSLKWVLEKCQKRGKMNAVKCIGPYLYRI